MSNSRKWTTDFNAKRDELAAFVKAKAGRSRIKRIEAVQRAATMPNSLPQSPRVAGQGAK
jgi:hypothetical protein